MSGIKIDNSAMPNRVGMGRISLNTDIGRQSQGLTFGEKVSVGLQNGANLVASGVNGLAGAIPGGSILSSAVSSVGRMGGGVSLGGSAAASAGYAVTGVVGNAGGLSTTVGSGGTGTISTGNANNGINLQTGSSSNNVGTMNSNLADQSSQMTEMLNVQIKMQQENQVFTSVSNVLKTKHDTVKNSISNIH